MRPHRQQPTRLPHPWDSPGKNTGVGCHFLLQCMKVKSESEVAQSCPTLKDSMDCSPPGSSVHGIFQARALEWGAIAFSGPVFTNHQTRGKAPETVRATSWVLVPQILDLEEVLQDLQTNCGEDRHFCLAFLNILVRKLICNKQLCH